MQEKRQYKRIKYLMLNTSKSNRINKLADLESKDPSKFWAAVKKITKKTPNEKPNISPEAWTDYFKDLLNVKYSGTSDEGHLNYVENCLPLIETLAEEDCLDHTIQLGELNISLKKAQNGKSTGPDLINNEMLKHGGDLLHQGLLHLFNVILTSGKYPEVWKSSIITPIHKGLDIHNPENYRGIAVGDSMSKLFCKIVKDRVRKHLTNNKFWKINQNGFMEKRRTDDNIMIVHTLFQKYVKEKKQKLYVAFVDFRKYFDSINRKFLLYKLLKCGITGNTYSILKSMYTDCYYSIKTNSGITNNFGSATGVKQGCSLSPTLSNIFQNDLHDIFDQTCHPIELDETYFNSLSWADDLVLISQSSNGLQACLNKLESYCNKWHLNVNVKKTKTMVMAPGNPKVPNFYFSGETLECVKTYKYLGLVISNNGKTTNMVNDRILKAKRASFALKQAISTTQNISTKLSLSLFDKQIEPILLYGSPIWGAPTCTCTLKIRGNILDSNTTKSSTYKCLTAIGISDMEIISCRRLKDNNSIVVTLKNISDKISIISNYMKSPATFTIEDINSVPNAVERLYSNFCKFSLGVSKYASTTLALNELGRYPIQIRRTVLAVLYWLRLEKGTENTLLNKAFNTMKQENHPWLQNIQYSLWQVGLGNIWFNPKTCKKNSLKLLLTTRLKDIYIQTFDTYCRDSINSEKCKVINACQQDLYETKPYLSQLGSANVRSMFTKMRIDANCTLDSQLRSFRNTKTKDPLCKECNDVQSATHVLLTCKNKDLTENRTMFENKICKHVYKYPMFSTQEKLPTVLNLKLLCKKEDQDDAIETICTFVKSTYRIVQNILQ